MMPYIGATVVKLGPIPIQVWGFFVAGGIVAGTWLSARFARRQQLDPDMIWRGASWIVIAAFVGARILHVMAYEPAYYWQHPLESLMFWHGGFSVMGGFLGAIAGFALFVRAYTLDWIRYSDAFIYGLPLGLGCGRIGCYLIHDHPGTATDFFLGVRHPDGQTRHELGLYDALQVFPLAVVYAFLARRQRPPLYFARLFLVWYGIARFLLDFLRLVDTKYAGLTPGQYGGLLMVAAGIMLYVRRPKLEREKPV